MIVPPKNCAPKDNFLPSFYDYTLLLTAKKADKTIVRTNWHFPPPLSSSLHPPTPTHPLQRVRRLRQKTLLPATLCVMHYRIYERHPEQAYVLVNRQEPARSVYAAVDVSASHRSCTWKNCIPRGTRRQSDAVRNARWLGPHVTTRFVAGAGTRAILQYYLEQTLKKHWPSVRDNCAWWYCISRRDPLPRRFRAKAVHLPTLTFLPWINLGQLRSSSFIGKSILVESAHYSATALEKNEKHTWVKMRNTQVKSRQSTNKNSETGGDASTSQARWGGSRWVSLGTAVSAL